MPTAWIAFAKAGRGGAADVFVMRTDGKLHCLVCSRPDLEPGRNHASEGTPSPRSCSQRRRALARVLPRPPRPARLGGDEALSDLPGNGGSGLPRTAGRTGRRPSVDGVRTETGRWWRSPVLRGRRRAHRVRGGHEGRGRRRAPTRDGLRREDPFPARGGSRRTGLLRVLRIRSRWHADRGVLLGDGAGLAVSSWPAREAVAA